MKVGITAEIHLDRREEAVEGEFENDGAAFDMTFLRIVITLKIDAGA